VKVLYRHNQRDILLGATDVGGLTPALGFQIARLQESQTRHFHWKAAYQVGGVTIHPLLSVGNVHI
jgi:hypothetical protein